jgi:hypothetical protein
VERQAYIVRPGARMLQVGAFAAAAFAPCRLPQEVA